MASGLDGAADPLGTQSARRLRIPREAVRQGQSSSQSRQAAAEPHEAAGEDVAQADTALFNEGYVTVVPIDGDLTASAAHTQALLREVPGLAP